MKFKANHCYTYIYLSCLLYTNMANLANDASNGKKSVIDSLKSSNTTLLSRKVNDKTFKDPATHDGLMHIVFWEVKPFLFTNENGVIDGIIPKMLANGEFHCKNTSIGLAFAAYNGRHNTRRVFYDTVRSNVPYGNGTLKHVDIKKALWVPVLSHIKKTPPEEFVSRRKLTAFQLFKSNHIAVIVPRATISLPNKIFRGLLACQQILAIALLLAILFGIFVWMIERKSNDEFPKPFYKGICTGLWWGVVSMSTVGYGDVVPRTPLGRSVAFFWLSIGVLVACLLTATMTDFVSGVGDLDVYGRDVSVLESSVEEKVASKDYGANVFPVSSYQDVLSLIREGKVFAGMMNADVAAWYQTEILDDKLENPLRIVQLLPTSINVNCLMSKEMPEEVKLMLRCMYKLREEVYDHSLEDFRRYCHTETLYVGSITDLFRNNIYLQVLLGLALGCVVIGLIFDSYTIWKRYTEQLHLHHPGKVSYTMETKKKLNGYSNGETKPCRL